MSTLEIVQKAGKKPEYKDYVSFLGTYKNGSKRDDQADGDIRAGNFSLTSSSNNSSSSINSDISDQSKKGFKEYLESYQSKKYSPVYPKFKKVQSKPDTTDGKIIKTEVYIEINNPTNTVSNVSKIFEKPSSNNNSSRVSTVSKMFEKNSTDTAKTVGSKVNHYKTQISNGMDEVHEEQRKISIGEISKKFECAPPPKTNRVPLKKTPSITEKSKFFEDNNVSSVINNRKEVEVKKNIFNEASQAFKEREKNENNFNKMNGPLSPKPQTNISQTLPRKTNNSPKLNGSTSPKPQLIISQALSNKIEVTLPIVNGSLNSAPKTNGLESKHESVHQISVIPIPPPPPPPQTIAVVTIIPSNVQNQEFTKKSLPPLTIQTDTENLPPPPPPLPSADIFTKTLKPPASPKPNLGQNVRQFPANGYNTLPKMQNGTKKDKVDGIAAPSLDKNDPRVKRLVYGALRDMYGAYHDKANDYLATLPKNRVRKNNGLDSIIDSIK